jgi:hypothetical protein
MRTMKGMRGTRRRDAVGWPHGYVLVPFFFFLLVAPIVHLKTASGAQDYQANEYEIKAAYLLQFSNFVEWLDSDSANLHAPMRVCFVGQDPLSSALARMIADHPSNGPSLVLRSVRHGEPIDDCHILYISRSEGKYIPQILDSVRNASVLTVGETEQFAAEGGMIQLVVEENRIKFKINPSAASKARIRISSRLLLLAQIVGPNDQSSLRTGKPSGI